MKFLELLKSNKKLHFLLKALKHINDEEYIDFFLDRESNPLLLEFMSKGENFPDKRFYIIKETGRGYGFFAEFHAMLAKLIFADMFGFSPVVFWGNNFLYYESEPINGTTNGYEYYFKQPMGYSEADVEKVLLRTDSKSEQAVWIERTLKKGEDISPSYEKRLAEVYKKYIRFNDTTDAALAKESTELLRGRKTLGVHFRGTDFKVNYDNHPICVTLQQEFQAIREALQEYPFEQIFLATDEIAAVKSFKEEFGSKLIWYQDVFRGDTEVSIAFSKSSREKHHYKLGYEVLRDMYTLSQCEGFIAGISQVSICTRVAKTARNEKYEYLKIINNGKNHNDRIFLPK